MLETYLFISPWGDECFNCEKDTIKYFKSSSAKVDLKIIPVLNLSIVKKYIIRQKKLGNTVSLSYNQLFQSMYLTSLDYIAACSQGRSKGRAFLTKAQHAIVDNRIRYTPKLGLELAKKSNLDLDMFIQDRSSDMTQTIFKKHQQLAHEMQIRMAPSAVIFNAPGEECAVLMEHYDQNSLAAICQLPLIQNSTPIHQLHTL